MREPTDAEMAAYEAWLAAKYGLIIADKDDSALMQLAAAFLAATGIIPDPANFLANFATTIGIYVFLPRHWTGWLRLQALAHEAQHVWQFRRYGTQYLWLDSTSGFRRALFEAEGYRVQFDLAWWRDGAINIGGWLPYSANYGLNAADRGLMDKAMINHQESSRAGLLGTEVSKDVVGYLDAHLPELKAAA